MNKMSSKMSLNPKLTTCLIFAILILVLALYIIGDFYTQNKNMLNPVEIREQYIRNQVKQIVDQEQVQPMQKKQQQQQKLIESYEHMQSDYDSIMYKIKHGQQIESFAKILDSNNEEQKAYLQEMRDRIQALIQDQINHPVKGTSAQRWQDLQSHDKMQNIQGLSKMDLYTGYQFAYTQNKGRLTKLCVADEKGFVNKDVNMYVLIHELTHAYDPKYLPNVHDEYFWILFSKLVMRAIDLGLLDVSVFDQKHCDCDTDVLDPVDYERIQQKAQQKLPERM